MNSKKIYLLITSLVCFSLVAFVVVNAQEPNNKPEKIANDNAKTVNTSANKKAGGNFCDKLENNKGSMFNRIKGPETKIKNTLGKERWGQKNNAFAKKIEGKRGRWDKNRGRFYLKLSEKFGNDAVKEYKESVEIALKAKREAINEALNTYNEFTSDVLSSHKDLLTAFIDEYRASSQALLDNAKENCEAGEITNSKKTLMDGLKELKEKFKEDQSALQNPISSLIEAKNILQESRKQATKTFVSSLQDAKEKFKENIAK